MNTQVLTMENPLLESHYLPAFSQIKAEHIEPALDAILADNRRQIEALLERAETPTWQSLVAPLEELDDHLNAMWSPVGHLHAVADSEALRAAYNACIPKLSAYATELGQNEKLYQAYKALAEATEFQQYDKAQKKVIMNELRDFKLSGVALTGEAKERYKQIRQQLAKLTTKYEENILDATQGWIYHVTEQALLSGLPPHAINAAAQAAKAVEKEGWLFNLEFPSYYAVISYADDRDFRKAMYTAYCTRASDQGPNAGKWDNTEVMEAILALRHELAQLLGYSNYAELSLATKMARDPEQVMDFMQDLVQRSRDAAQKEFAELTEFAQQHFQLKELAAWDVAYMSEKLRQAKYAISQEALRPYFPEDQVFAGMFALVKRLYGIDIKEDKDADIWHEHVRFFTIYDENGEKRGQFYTDLYARPHKRGGAWMDECRVRRRLSDGKVNIPVAYLTCNFSAPSENSPSLLTHNEVETLFHEFGHTLHHLLTQVDYAGVSGINGVAWDAVELPSQFMENWCWEKDVIDTLSKHYKTGETLPQEQFERLRAAKTFQGAMQMVRQLGFSLFDFRIHLEYDSTQGGRVQAILDEVRGLVDIAPIPKFNRFQHGFSHIFAGGYAAGYYSYKWAEVLSSDAFARFEEEGLQNTSIGRDFLHAILEQGGSEEPLDLFVKFRGREPKIDALLCHTGVSR